MKTTQYFEFIRSRSDRSGIQDVWIESAIAEALEEEIQSDGNISEKGIKIQFKYDKKAKIIYTNRFHTIKIIPSKET